MLNHLDLYPGFISIIARSAFGVRPRHSPARPQNAQSPFGITALRKEPFPGRCSQLQP